MKKVKKLALNRETVANLQQVAAGRAVAPAAVDSDGPVICWISDCNPCEGTVYASPLPVRVFAV